jgi:diguanylate cyclase (GGDEF)-like protein
VRRLRARWPAWAGLAAAVAIVAAFGLTELGDAAVWREARPFGVPLDGWGLGVTAVAVGLAGQLALQARVSLQRERRLVETAAALRLATAELERLATTDALTGLLNRRRFAERLGVELRRAARYGRPVAVVMLDLDHFKQVNDGRGHQFGDRVLVTATRTLRAQVRESDVVGRYGGEEFIVLLPETGLRAATIVAEKLRSAIAAAPFGDEGAALQLTISAGVAAYPECGAVDEDALVRLADEALYQAKRAGRNRVMTAEPGPREREASGA